MPMKSLRACALIAALVSALMAARAAAPADPPNSIDGGDIAVVASKSVVIVKPDTLDSRTLCGGSFVNPIGIAFEPIGSVVVADAGPAPGPPGSVIRCFANGEQEVVSTGGEFRDPFGIAVAGNGDIFVGDYDGQNLGLGIVKVDPATGAQEVVCSSDEFVNPSGVVVLPNGDRLLADEQPRVILCHPDKTWETFVEGPPLENADNLALGADGSILVTDHEVGVIRVDPATKQMTVACGGFRSAYGIAVEPTGDWLVADSHVGLFRVTPENFPDCPRQRILDQPAFGVAVAPGADAAVNVSADVQPREEISVSAPVAVPFGKVVIGRTYAIGTRVTVTSTYAGGYQLAVSRTRFTNGDLDLSIRLPAAPPGTTPLISQPPDFVPIPKYHSLDIGRRTGPSAADGDAWLPDLVLPVRRGDQPLRHDAIVTFTAVGF